MGQAREESRGVNLQKSSLLSCRLNIQILASHGIYLTHACIFSPDDACRIPCVPVVRCLCSSRSNHQHSLIIPQVDATVLEVGLGGAYDSTNIVSKPVVTGITALGIDHVSVLGATIKEIAWHKAGIYKVGLPLLTTVTVMNPTRQEGVPALTVEQPAEGTVVLKQVAEEKKASPTRNPAAASVLPSARLPASLWWIGYPRRMR